MMNLGKQGDGRSGGWIGATMLAALGSALVVLTAPVLAHGGPPEPVVPADLKVPDGNKLFLHLFAVGVQIYTATPSTADPTQLVWTFKAPEADLFRNDGREDDDEDEDRDGDEDDRPFGKHYAGPTWEARDGSKVVGARVAGVTVDPTAIPWLLLKAVSTSDDGVFSRTTYIQRLHTTGGLAPSTAPTEAGQEARVPYTAEYFFYRAMPVHDDPRAPAVPAELKVPDGNKLSLHVFAVGVQIYTATPSPTDPTQLVWTFKAPEADLFKHHDHDDDDDDRPFGIHYAGPTWQSRNGSKVVGARVAGVTVDPTAIPWLLLKAVSTSDYGVFSGTTYIQRLNTTGGLAPSTAPSQAGEEARVGYTAEYFFYRARSHGM
jgi:uncharacterized protein DUF3455